MSNKRNFVLTKWFKQNWMFLWYVIMSIQFWRAHLGQFIFTQQLLEIIFDTTSEKIMNWKIICPRKFQFSKTRNLNVFHHNNTPLNIVQSKYYFLCPQRKIYIFHSLRDDMMIILYCNNANTSSDIYFQDPRKNNLPHSTKTLDSWPSAIMIRCLICVSRFKDTD